MDDATLLREAAGELRTVARLAGDPNGPLSRALPLAASDATWRGAFAQGFIVNLQFQQRGLIHSQEALEQLAAWLERIAAEREAVILPETR